MHLRLKILASPPVPATFTRKEVIYPISVPNSMNTTQFTVGQMVALTEEWSPNRNPDLRFHSGTVGKVEQVSDDHKVTVSMQFPHSPPMIEEIPASVLKRA